MAYSHKHRRRRRYKKAKARKKLHPAPVSAKQHYVLDQAQRLVLTPTAGGISNAPQQLLTTILAGHNVSGVALSFSGFPHVGDWMIIFLLSGYTSSSLIRDYLFYVKRLKHWIKVTNETNMPVKVTVWRHRATMDFQQDSTLDSPDKALEGCLTSEGMPAPAAGTRTTQRNLSFKDSSTIKEYFTSKICKTKLLQAGESLQCTYVNKKATGFLHSSVYGNNLSSQPVIYSSRKYTHYWTVQANPELTGDITTVGVVAPSQACVFTETKDFVDWYMTAGGQLAETNYQFAGYAPASAVVAGAFMNPFTGTQQTATLVH